MTHDRIWELIALKWNNESLSEEEEAALAAWMAENPEEKQLAGQLEKYYRAYQLEAGIDAEMVYPAIIKGVAARKALRRRRWWRVAGAAASVLLLIGTAYWWNREKAPSLSVSTVQSEIHAGGSKAILTLASGEQIALHAQKELILQEADGQIYSQSNVLTYAVKEAAEEAKPVYNKLEIPRGGEYRLVLSDGTRVWLNSETQLTYPVTFPGDERRITLTGEAYFEVADDSLRPFTVTSRGMNIQVVGTSFNVTAYEDMAEVITTLASGAVRVNSVKDHKNGGRLQPGEQSVFYPASQQFITQKVDVSLYTSWKEGYYHFERETLEKIMHTLSRWYDVDVFFENQAVRQIHFTGKVKRYADITEFLDAIRMTEDVDFRIKGKTVWVRHK